MKKVLFVLMLLTIFIKFVNAQSVSIECDPNILYPNDVADCKLKVTFPDKTYVSGIGFISSGIDVIPQSISGIGWVTSYELNFNVKARDVGVQTVFIYINTINGTIKQAFNIHVVDDLPEIVLNKTVFYSNEVNVASYEVVAPLTISNVIVKPLFDANPQIIYGKNGVFKFIPNDTNLKFEIQFYNGRNRHVIIQEVDVKLERSKGVLVNITPDYPMMLIGDVIPIHIEITNLRTDKIFDLRIKSNAVPSSLTIPLLKSGESKIFDIKFCSNESGNVSFNLYGNFKDEFNNEYSISSTLYLTVLNETTLQFSGIDVEKVGEITISGDISNNGKSKVYNIYITAIADGVTKTYYIDSLDPSDFDSFEFVFENASNILLKAKWNNELGYAFEIEEKVEVPNEEIIVKKEENILVPIVVLIAVITIVAISWWKYARRTGSKKSEKD